MSRPHVLFVVDAGPTVGGGHVMRSLTLARALEALGASYSFVASTAVAEVLDIFAPGTPQVPAASAAARDLVAAAQSTDCEACVFDHYGLGEREHRAMSHGRPTLIIDDLANRPVAGDIILDSGPARAPEDYAGLVPAGAELLLGPVYAPIRPEFAGLRDTVLSWRGDPVQRILVSMGLTDLDGITARIVEVLRPRIGDVALDIVLGASAPSLPGLAKVARRDTRLMLHVDTPHMARVTAEADFAVGAAGSSVWERCTLGLPSVIAVLADNQKAAAASLAERGAALVVDTHAPDFNATLERAIMRLLRDDNLRRTLAMRSAEVCDGLGAGRVADSFLRLIAGRAG
jgi:UDP-2,4-diacetamido-2,4,6-trideoxy-beta-L-altropyranose hydrolase